MTTRIFWGTAESLLAFVRSHACRRSPRADEPAAVDLAEVEEEGLRIDLRSRLRQERDVELCRVSERADDVQRDRRLRHRIRDDAQRAAEPLFSCRVALQLR